MHRDLKPRNILINEKKGIIKLADFGLACAFEKSNCEYTHDVVTMWYRPPELLLSRVTKYSFEIDIWSSGCIFAELATGQTLFKGKSEIDQHRIINELCETSLLNRLFGPKIDVNKLKNLVNELDSSGFQLLTKMLTYVPKKRIKAAEILDHDYFMDLDIRFWIMIIFLNDDFF